MNIIEKNKLIAEFMGYKYYPYTYELKKQDSITLFGWRKYKRQYLPGGINLSIGKKYYLGRRHKDLKFDSDWNWLMDVVNYIKKQHLNKEFNTIEKSLLSADIQKVWESVIIFIENFALLETKTIYNYE